jgi:hypothetical protein
MKRIALLLAAAISSAGCVVTTSTPTGDLTVDWSYYGLTSSTGATGLACNAGTFQTLAGDVDGVYQINVYVDGFPEVTGRLCSVGYATILGLDEGLHDVVVEGLDYSGNLVMVRDWNTVDVIANVDTTYDFTPGETRIQVDYHFSPVDSCYATSAPEDVNTYIRYEVTEQTFGDVYSNSSNFSPTCGSAIVLRVPWGRYTVDWVDEYSYNPNNSTFTLRGASSAPVGPTTVWDPGNVIVPLTIYVY